MKRERGEGRVYKQPGSKNFWIQYHVGGRLIRESSGSEKSRDAQKLLTKRLNDANEGKAVGPEVERVTLNDLCELVRNNYRMKGRRSGKRLEISLAHLIEYFGGDRKAVSITSAVIDKYALDRREQSHHQGSSTANGTVNRELAALKRAFTLAIDKDILMRKPKITMLAEAEPREGFVEQAEFVALRDSLPEYLKDPITFLWLTSWRPVEMRTLEWKDVNPDRTLITLSPAKSKNKEGRTLPVSGELIEVIERAHAARRLDCRFVFHHDGKPIIDFRKAWRKTRKAVGQDKLLAYDLRRSSIRNLVRSGVTEKVAMKLSGHKTRAVFDRYNIIDESDLIQAVERRDAYLDSRPVTPKVVPIRKAE